MFKIATSLDDLLKAFMVRAIVFVEEQRVPYGLEMDEYEHSATHILGEREGEPIAAGRIRYLGDYAKLERIAVRKAYRGTGIGHQLVDYMVSISQQNGFSAFKMHAQAHLTDFYGKHGFIVQGELFVEAGIDHYLMLRDDR
ncbi:MAG TPA: GNAT family N-acetyltransferase [bacterium]|nr:GNAT family N-acetyltransferase [bacterium]HOX84627.1 GNAT family N-acetyltransferase [bacterium]HPG45350.1 GNAT family N-acetyltransferase [bacterium]HPM96874.1 GNAT family N-acetyltransferase [bacterium]